MSDFISINGSIRPHDAARISPSDAGFLHGAGLFETMRACNGRVFRLADHLARLTASARIFSLPLALEESQLAELIGELLEANNLTDARVRITVSRGDLHEITAENPIPPITLLISADAFVPYPAVLYENGMMVGISRFKQNPESPFTGHKTTSYMDRLAALQEAKSAGSGEALCFTVHTHMLAEGCISNVFLVDDQNTLLTPPLFVPGKADQPLCLPGITRRLILQLAAQEKISAAECPLAIQQLLAAKEIFLTNTIMGVMPVTRIERHAVADEKPGLLTQKLRTLYEKAMAAQCPQQSPESDTPV